MALQGDTELTHIGGSMACDLRNELRNKKINHIENIIHQNSPSTFKKSNIKDQITLNHSNIFTVCPITAKISPDTTINECYTRLNQCLRHHFDANKEELFDYRSQMGQTNPEYISNGVMICFSNLGNIRVKKPVKDLNFYNR
ncbi:hypothetical protein M9Y10_042288 [Tritrichomonas musculus]|uniref:Uncharacterized protein n=1 Tax=Tritrichomonas musculus TaxID=1915356 RepID=A0ABR2GP93_9EUKA